MPNWVYSKLTVEGKTEDLQKFKEAASKKNKISEGWDTLYWNLFDSLYPMPEEYRDTVSGLHPVLVSDEIAEQNGGARDWYNWQLIHWGVKWGDCHTTLESDLDNELYFSLDFPWGIPTPAMLKISADYPNLCFTLDMDEEGGFFYGSMIFEDGDIVEDCVIEGPSPDLYPEDEQ